MRLDEKSFLSCPLPYFFSQSIVHFEDAPLETGPVNKVCCLFSLLVLCHVIGIIYGVPAIFPRVDWWDKSNVTWLLMGQTSDKIRQLIQESRSSLFIKDNRKWRTFHLKDDTSDKLRLEVIIVTFLNEIATVAVLTESNVYVKLDKTRSVYICMNNY